MRIIRMMYAAANITAVQSQYALLLYIDEKKVRRRKRITAPENTAAERSGWKRSDDEMSPCSRASADRVMPQEGQGTPVKFLKMHRVPVPADFTRNP
jgi:hypothetical protein